MIFGCPPTYTPIRIPVGAPHTFTVTIGAETQGVAIPQQYLDMYQCSLCQGLLRDASDQAMHTTAHQRTRTDVQQELQAMRALVKSETAAEFNDKFQQLYDQINPPEPDPVDDKPVLVRKTRTKKIEESNK